jgi:hypothetical protein
LLRGIAPTRNRTSRTTAPAKRSPDRRDIDGIKERIVSRFERIEAGVGRQKLHRTGILATGAAIIKMIDSTRMTSMNGVTLISWISPSVSGLRKWGFSG